MKNYWFSHLKRRIIVKLKRRNTNTWHTNTKAYTAFNFPFISTFYLCKKTQIQPNIEHFIRGITRILCDRLQNIRSTVFFQNRRSIAVVVLVVVFFGHRRVQRSRVNNRFLYGHGIINPSMFFHACWPFIQLCWLTIHFLKHLNESTPFYCCIRLLISVEFETFPDAFHGYELFCHSFSTRNYFNYLIDSNKKLTSCSFFKLLEIVLL